eukprot:CAMPEP_0194284276 /NCGR_PEP_ID=MMETSP0169-20130528/27212_1 /TAXON_ID=218684 /ORGANISM="Corethron pennatum, Strain L29A3" /LENGTH=247 /DNA_ID=CAMNT_0039030051 /DNA_START=260 /DNA_END=1003 /DNA_ORIENTATION=-
MLPTAQTPLPSSSIQAVATRIQERATQLVAEQEKLTTAQRLLSECELELKTARSENAAFRIDFLRVLRRRDGLELELLTLRTRLEKTKTEKNTMEADIEIFDCRRKKEEEDYKQAVVTTYGPHEFRLEMYARKNDVRRRRLEEQDRKKQEELDLLLEEARELWNHTTWIERQCEDLKKKKNRIDAEEEEWDLSERLTEKVKMILEERTFLRSALKLAKEDFQEANEVMIHSENELMELSSKALHKMT